MKYEIFNEESGEYDGVTSQQWKKLGNQSEKRVLRVARTCILKYGRVFNIKYSTRSAENTIESQLKLLLWPSPQQIAALDKTLVVASSSTRGGENGK